MEIAKITFGPNPTELQIEQIRELIRTTRADICQAIENPNDPVFGEDVCMEHVRSELAEQHQCLPGKLVYHQQPLIMWYHNTK